MLKAAQTDHKYIPLSLFTPTLYLHPLHHSFSFFSLQCQTMKKRAHIIVPVYLDFFWVRREYTMQICIQFWIINVAKNVLPVGLFSIFHPLFFFYFLKTLCLYPAAFNLSPASLDSRVAGCTVADESGTACFD